MEVLVAAGLAGLVLAIAARLMVPTLHAFARGSTRSEMQQEALVALSRLGADLEATSAATVALLTPAHPTDPTALALVRVDSTVPPDGAVTWETAVVVYAYDPVAGRLVRRVFAPPQPLAVLAGLDATAPRRVTTDLLKQMAATSAPGEDVLATGVTRFTVADGTPGVPTPPFTLDLALQRRGSHQATPEVLEMTRTVATRNHT